MFSSIIQFTKQLSLSFTPGEAGMRAQEKSKVFILQSDNIPSLESQVEIIPLLQNMRSREGFGL